MDIFNMLTVMLALVVGAVLGAAGYALRLRKKEDVEQPLPDRWPLTARGLMTSEEYEVMVWLQKTFPKHLVMLKLPVIRFTIPVSKETTEESKRLQTLIDGVYCSFSVCTPNGAVVGCVDVPGKRGLPRGNRDLKESLLSDCAIAYTVIRGFDLPKPAAMRAAFLGEMNAEDLPQHQETRGGDSSFHADLNAFTRKARSEAKKAALEALNRDSDTKRLPASNPGGFDARGLPAAKTSKTSRSKHDWEDSFIAPADSRPAKLDNS